MDKDQKTDGQTIGTDGLKENPGVKGAASDAEKKGAEAGETLPGQDSQ